MNDIGRLIDRITAQVVVSLRARGVQDRVVYDRARRRGGGYGLRQLEGIISRTYDEDSKRGYIRNWLDRAEAIVTPPPGVAPRLDADEWRRRLERNRMKWRGLY